MVAQRGEPAVPVCPRAPGAPLEREPGGGEGRPILEKSLQFEIIHGNSTKKLFTSSGSLLQIPLPSERKKNPSRTRTVAASPKRIDLSPNETNALIERVKRRSLADADYEILLGIIQMVLTLHRALQEKRQSISRLLRLFFGAKTETAENILKETQKTPSREDGVSEPSSAQEATGERKAGHGRNGAASYRNASRVHIPHESLKRGERCPLCPKGRLYPLSTPAVIVRMTGQAPVLPTIYECERLRCNLCGEVFTAKLPDGVGDEKYDETSGAIIACMKYGSGFPFHRMERLQENLEVPLPASTQWDIAQGVADKAHPAFLELVRKGAQGEILHNDDTSMRVLALSRDLEAEDAERKGVFTTGVVSICQGKKIALFYTGNRHAGENLAELLRKRAEGLPPPIQMCDALSRNEPEGFETILSNCLAHGRRNFVDVYPNFPEECRYLIETLGKVYHVDAISKKRNLSPEERLQFHQVESGPVMDELESWLNAQFDEKRVEPNSGLGKAIKYLLKRWQKFTLFLRVTGAPLDNNVCERALKRAILHRKNSLYFRTEHGAYIGDMFMSLIHTCELAGANPFDYLVALQKNAREVRAHPEGWLPWNYLERSDRPPS